MANALVRKASDQTSANYNTGTGTNIAWDTEVTDDSGWHSGSGSFFTVPAGVAYVRVLGNVYSPNTTNGLPLLRIGKGGSPWTVYAGEAIYRNDTTSTDVQLNVCSPIIPVSPGDTFDLLYFGDGSCDITATRSSFSIESIYSGKLSGALVTKSAAQSGDFTAATAVTYDTEQYDIGGWFDSASSTTRLTVPSGVQYVRITACHAVSSFVGGEWIRGSVRKNGVTTAFMPKSSHEASGVMYLNYSSPVLPVTAGDYFQQFVQVEADTATTIDVNNTSFSIEKVDAATFSGALVTKASDQLLANYTTDVAVTWDDETGGGYDLGGWHDNSTNNTRLTVPAGVSRVRLRAQLDITGASVGGVSDACRILKNGSEDWDGRANGAMRPTASVRTHNICTPVVNVTPGDYFELKYFISTDTAINVLADTSWFFIEAVPEDAELTISGIGGGTVDFIGQALAAGEDRPFSATGLGTALFAGTAIQPSVLNALAQIDSVFEGVGAAPPPLPQVSAGGFGAILGGPTWKTWWEDQKAWEDEKTLRINTARESPEYKRLKRKLQMLEDSREWAGRKSELERRIKEILRQIEALESNALGGG